jgi:hypothetical protein
VLARVLGLCDHGNRPFCSGWGERSGGFLAELARPFLCSLHRELSVRNRVTAKFGPNRGAAARTPL